MAFKKIVGKTPEQEKRLKEIGNIDQLSEFQQREVAAGTAGQQSYTIPGEGGSQRKVTEAEFNAFKGTQGFQSGAGQMTSAVQEAVKAQQENELKTRLTQQNIQTQTLNKILEKEGKDRGIIPDASLITQPTVKPTRVEEAAGRVRANLKAQEGTLQGLLPEPVRREAQVFGQTVKETASLRTAALVVDAWRTTLTGKKPLVETQATEDFTIVETNLRRDVGDLALGLADAGEVNRKLQDAQDIVGRLEEFQHSEGMKASNLQYQIDQGAGVETKIRQMKETINELLIKARIAEQAGNIARMKALMGVQQ